VWNLTDVHSITDLHYSNNWKNIKPMMGVKIGEVELDISNISQADMEKLKKMLPDLQQSGKLSQLDIILEAIQYIKTLQYKLRTK
jgi:hypothetical protein